MIKLLLKIAGKDSFEIDKRISIDYIIRLCVKYGMMLIRGFAVGVWNPQMSNKIFIGHKVKLIKREYLQIGRNVKIHDRCKIDALSTDGVKLGDNVVLGRNTIIECTGGIGSLGKGVSIGDRTCFANDCFFGAAGGIEIGRDVIAGQYIRFHSENHNYDDLDTLISNQGITREGIKIGNNCWIGAGAVFLDGAELSDGTVVAANSVVTKKFPPNCVVGGGAC